MVSPISPSVPGRKEQFSTRVAFFVTGFAMAAWAPLVPYVKAGAGLSDGALGMLLLCLGAGSIAAMPLSGVGAKRYGCRRLLLLASALMVVALPVLALSSSVWVLSVALFLFGAGVGAMDCVMNVQAIIVERASGRAMMSGFHGLFSVGGFAGAGAMTLLLSAGAAPWLAALCVVGLVAAAMCAALPHFLAYGAQGEGRAFAIPRGVVLVIGVLCFIAFLAEGAMLDWSAVFLTSVRNVDPAIAGLGYAAFASAMTAIRLTGDAIVNRVGARLVLFVGPLCASFGLLLVALVPTPWVAIIGFGLVGVGCANVVPVLFSAIGRQKTLPEHIAVPAVTTLGYAGILAGPAVIGFAAQLTGLSLALIFVAVLLAGVAAGGRALRI